MKLKTAALAAALMVSAAPALATYAPNSNFGLLDNTTVDFKGASQPGAFVHDYFFSLAGNGAAVGGVFDMEFAGLVDITGLTVTLFGPGAYSSGVNDNTPSSIFFAGLTPGNFKFTVTGNAAGVLGGSYQGAIGTVTTPVPEPASIALLLAGLGVVGWVARRRKAG